MAVPVEKYFIACLRHVPIFFNMMHLQTEFICSKRKYSSHIKVYLHYLHYHFDIFPAGDKAREVSLCKVGRLAF